MGKVSKTQRLWPTSGLCYVQGLGLVTLSSVIPSLHPSECRDIFDSSSCPPTRFQVTVFFSSLYLVALAQGGHKPCLQAFGADQFDETDPEESISKSSFFNWWNFSASGGVTLAILMTNFIQENVGWAVGFGVPCISMMFALTIFLLGTKTYRFYLLEQHQPLMRIGRGITAVVQSCVKPSNAFSYDDDSRIDEGRDNLNDIHVEEAKQLLRLFPIWATSLIYAVVMAQPSTFFTKQGRTLDRRIGSSLQVPPAALQSFISLSILCFIPIYDRIIVPTKFSSAPAGLSLLQRIGIGMVLSTVSMVTAALVESKRLKTVRDFGLVDLPNATIPMSLWWMVPQYVLCGVSDVFTIVGLQEFFYDQVPDSLRSLGVAFYLSILAVGSFTSGALVSAIDGATKVSGDSWFADNLNRAHLDYFYWLLAALSVLDFVTYLFFASCYVYKKKECRQV